MPTIFTQQSGYPVAVLGPSADLYAGDPTSVPLDRALYDHVTFLVVEGAGGVGTATIKVQAVTRVAAALDPVDLPFHVRVTAAGSRELGALQAVAATGYATVAGANKLIAIEVQAYGDETHPCVRLAFTAGAAGAVVGSVVALFTRPRFGVQAPAASA